MLSLEQLKIFITTAQCGSFSAAARQLGKAQSAVSQSIANSEIDLGVELFDRSSRIPRLTSEGERLLKHAEAVLIQHQALLSTAASFASEGQETFTLALDNSLACCDLKVFFVAFSQRYPQITLEVLSGLSIEVPSWVADGKADLGYKIMDGRYRNGVEVSCVQLQAFTLVCGKFHPLARLNNPRKIDFMQHRQIQVRELADHGVANLVPVSPTVWWTNDQHTLLSMVEAGCGWSFLPNHLALNGLKSGTLKALDSPFNEIPFTLVLDRIVSNGNENKAITLWVAEQIELLFQQNYPKT